MALTDMINKEILSDVSDDQGDWRQFVLDHLDYIAFRSQIFSIDPVLMNSYRYDLRRFLKEYMHRHEDITWIVCLINSYRNDFDFVDISKIIVPDDRLITDLYHSYISIKSNAN